MELAVHPQVYSDIRRIVAHYEREVPGALALEFRAELFRVIADARERPTLFAVRRQGFRRANLQRFPYHVLFSIDSGVVGIFAVRHHRQNPGFGTRRKLG